MKAWKPQFSSVPLANGRKWRGGGGWRYEEKKDGRWGERLLGSSVLAGEVCRDGLFWVFDVPIFDGADVRRSPLSARLEMLAGIQLPDGWIRIPHGSGGEFLEAVLASGGEGIVAKHLETTYGQNWIKCKRSETHDCIVSEIHPLKLSVRLSQADGERVIDCGWVPVLSETKFARLQVGTVIEVACHSRHSSGKFREPRFLRLRADKAAGECVA
jgi:ATP-dependent DNA ligase